MNTTVPIRKLVTIAIAIVCSLGLSATPAKAQETPKTCAGVEVRTVHVSIELDRGDSFLPDPSPKIAEVPGKIETLTAIGPPLGSMDSSQLQTALACTQKGIALTATITRSANFQGAVLQNVVWRPRIQIEVGLHQAEVIVATTWRMRLTTGAEVNQAETPAAPYPDQQYPITVTKILSFKYNGTVGGISTTVAMPGQAVDHPNGVGGIAVTNVNKTTTYEYLGGTLIGSTLLTGSQVAATTSGLAYNRVTQTFDGTVTITNVSSSTIAGPFQIVLNSLTSGVTVANATSTFGGWSYVTVPTVSSLAPGQSATVPVQFKNPSNATIRFIPLTYVGSFVN